ncbi:unnamed protein product, partial [Sphacelaria rigidula]
MSFAGVLCRCKPAWATPVTGYLVARRVIVSIRSFQSANEEETPADEAVERLVDRGPDMFMDPAEERGARERTLEDSVQQAEMKGLSADDAHCLRDILARHVHKFRRALRGDPPARVEPMKEAVKAKPRRCDPVNPVWLAL